MAENSVTIWGLAEGHKLQPATEEQVRGIAAEQADRAVKAAGVLTAAQVEEIARRVTAAVLADSGQGTGIKPTPLPSTTVRRAIVLGDSHSDTTWPQAGGVWWWQVAADLAGVTVLDSYAVGGMTTRDALNGWGTQSPREAVPQIVSAEGSDADLALVEFGGNDVVNGVSLDEYRANLTQITQRLMRAGKRVLFMFPPPLFPSLMEQHGATYAEYRRTAEEVMAACSAYYTDAWAAVGTETGGAMPAAYDSGDGMHMNGTGQAALGRAVAQRVQQVAKITDPYAGDRSIRWFGWETVQGDKELVKAETGPADALFKGTEVAVVKAPPQGTESVAVYSQLPGAPGTRWEVSYAYRIESSYGDAALIPGYADWPGSVLSEYPQRDHLAGMQGVRRYETKVPPGATDGRVFVLNVPATGGGLTARVGLLGVRKLS